ncbi:P-loop containing nucleoside triphosphate hydrolase protein [Schizopora paradoxa]|uniref:p-loop containing nucleoside triphosphate hydrolase protein n=1 Tax=Schizopora paradoxa TaxID=27342 RepID=A0A0H2S2K5_9AGAM|nr:P-loop containing nucleoside triphosphate hydrolase protein [Schizopora paradoxa]
MLWRSDTLTNFKFLFRTISRRGCAQRRNHSTVLKNDPSKTRNFALVAHIDSGKTTLTESILSTSGYLSSPGTVDTGSTTTDFLPAERERGITIQSASIPVSWKDWTFNLIDTPGHADFGMEVESASRVVDGAVVLIDAVEGVESQTQGVWRQLDKYGVKSRLLFLNKMDRPGASFRSSLLSVLNYRLHPRPMALTLPVASFDPQAYKTAEPGVEGVVDLVHWCLWKWNSEGNASRYELPQEPNNIEDCGLFPKAHPIIPHLGPARTSLLENLSMFSDDLMERLLEDPSSTAHLSIGASDLLPILRSAVLEGEVLPVLCGSAMKHIGTSLVLDYAGHLFPNPLDGASANSMDDPNVRMLAWKVAWDKRRGWMTFVRVYSGTLTRQSTLLNVTRNQKEKVSKLLLLYANEPEEVDSLPFGSVGVILGLKYTRTGDTLTTTGKTQKSSSISALQDITPPPAVMSAAIVPHSKSDLEPVQGAVLALSRTDPSARVEVSEGQLLVHGLGSLHLEIIEGRLRDEWGVNFESGRRRVTYREGFGGEEETITKAWNTEVYGKQITISVTFKIRSLSENERGDPAWDENIVLNAEGRPVAPPDLGRDNKSPWTYIAQGVASAISASPHTSLPVSRAHVQIMSYTLPEGTGVSILGGALSSILREHFSKTPTGPIMEPYTRLRITVTDDSFGAVVKHLIESDGELLDSDSQVISSGEESIPYTRDGVYIPPEWMSPSASTTSNSSHSAGQKRVINAVAPLSKMLDFSNRLRAISGGHGTFEMSNAGFRAVSDTRKLEILREMGRA